MKSNFLQTAKPEALQNVSSRLLLSSRGVLYFNPKSI
jgi:hypothetical protein